MVGNYDLWLVALSVAVASLASYVALDAASRVAASPARAARIWLAGGAVSMGMGIWSMHFIGMLAFRLPIPMSYDIPVTLLSLLVAVLVSGFALYVASREQLGMRKLLVAGTVMGAGIAVMHYTGMAAMQMSPPIRYDTLLLGLSLLVAVAASIAALWLAFRLRAQSMLSALGRRAGSALAMGGAIAGMHYTGMAAARFAPDSICLVQAQDINNLWLGMVIGGFALLFLMVTLLISVFDARMAEHSALLAETLRASNAELATASERFRLMSRATNDAVWDWDLTDDSLWWSDGFYTLFGYRHGEVEPGVESWVSRIHLYDRERVSSGIRRVIDAGGETWSDEYRFRRADGSDAHVLDRGYVSRDAAGRPLRMIGAMMDISERKSAQELVLDLNVRLEERVRERTAQLESAVQEMESFSYSVSHDLRAPLRAIDGNLGMLREELGGLPPGPARLMDNISRSALRMARLIDDLLELARTSRTELSLGPVDIAAVADDVRRELMQAESGRNIEWRIGTLPAVMADAKLLRPVLVNLLSNALKFTRQRDPALIEISAAPGGYGETVICVRDNGVGFDMRYAAKLFGVFSRLHHEREFAGTGIGLAIVHRAVARFGGRVWAEGEPGRGARFYVALRTAA